MWGWAVNKDLRDLPHNENSDLGSLVEEQGFGGTQITKSLGARVRSKD